MIIGILRSLRPKQWTKNGAIFVALIFDVKLFQSDPLLKTLLGFFLLCFIAGTVYLINDLVDIEKDRQHPTKKNRPIPAGIVPYKVAILAAILIPVICLPLSYWLNIYFGLIMTGYLLLQTAYSFVLKNIVIVDVLTIAGRVCASGGGWCGADRG